jgi:hypothetical protein
MCTGYPFNPTPAVQGVFLSTASSIDVLGGCTVFYHQKCERASPLLAVWACRVYVSLFLNVGLSGIRSVRYRNKQKCRRQIQSGTGKRGPSQVPECSGTRLRDRMTECQCRRQRPRCRCSAVVVIPPMVAMALCHRHPDHYSTSA